MDTSILGTLAMLAPDLMEEMELRALILERVAALEPIGRRALAQRLCMERPRVALLGGLLQNDTPYAQVVRGQLAAVCEPAAPEHDALWGAAQLAYEWK